MTYKVENASEKIACYCVRGTYIGGCPYMVGGQKLSRAVHLAQTVRKAGGTATINPVKLP